MLQDSIAHAVLHPAGVHKQEFAVLGKHVEEFLEERVALLALADAREGRHAEEAGIHLRDQLVDEIALSGAVPALEQHDHRKLGLADVLLTGNQRVAERFDLVLALFFVHTVVFTLKILQHQNRLPVGIFML